MFIPPVDPDFHFVLNSFSLETFKKHLLHWSVGGDAVLHLLYAWESILSCFWYIFFLGLEFCVNYISLSTLRCGVNVLWLTLFIYLICCHSHFFCSAVSVFVSDYISLVYCFKQWIMMCLYIVVILLVLELIELLCLWV